MRESMLGKWREIQDRMNEARKIPDDRLAMESRRENERRLHVWCEEFNCGFATLGINQLIQYIDDAIAIHDAIVGGKNNSPEELCSSEKRQIIAQLGDRAAKLGCPRARDFDMRPQTLGDFGERLRIIRDRLHATQSSRDSTEPDGAHEKTARTKPGQIDHSQWSRPMSLKQLAERITGADDHRAFKSSFADRLQEMSRKSWRFRRDGESDDTWMKINRP